MVFHSMPGMYLMQCGYSIEEAILDSRAVHFDTGRGRAVCAVVSRIFRTSISGAVLMRVVSRIFRTFISGAVLMRLLPSCPDCTVQSCPAFLRFKGRLQIQPGFRALASSFEVVMKKLP